MQKLRPGIGSWGLDSKIFYNFGLNWPEKELVQFWPVLSWKKCTRKKIRSVQAKIAQDSKTSPWNRILRSGFGNLGPKGFFFHFLCCSVLFLCCVLFLCYVFVWNLAPTVRNLKAKGGSENKTLWWGVYSPQRSFLPHGFCNVRILKTCFNTWIGFSFSPSQ